MASAQAVRRKFPTQRNRELFRRSREFWRRNREFHLPKPKSSWDEVFGTHTRENPLFSCQRAASEALANNLTANAEDYIKTVHVRGEPLGAFKAYEGDKDAI